MHSEDFKLFPAAGRLQAHAVAGPGFHEAPGEGRDPADVLAPVIAFVDANDRDDLLLAGSGGDEDGGGDEE